MPSDLLSLIFLALVGLTPVVALGITFYRLPFTPAQSALYVIARLMTRLLWRARVRQPLHLARDQGGLLICNHRSSIDPFFIQTVLDRQTHWMVAKEYCVHPAFGWFLRTVGAIPVNRGGIDTAATRTALRLVSRGGLVGIFPEGRINLTQDFMLPYRPGAILVALRGRAPVIPCYIEGSPYDGRAWGPFFMPAHVNVYFGTPIDLSAYYEAEPTQELLRQLMEKCLLQVAALASHPDFQPRPAGRRWKPTDQELDDLNRERRRRG